MHHGKPFKVGHLVFETLYWRNKASDKVYTALAEGCFYYIIIDFLYTEENQIIYKNKNAGNKIVQYLEVIFCGSNVFVHFYLDFFVFCMIRCSKE